MPRLYEGCTYQEVMEEVAKLLVDKGYIIREEVQLDTTQNFKVSITNAFLGEHSPWFNTYNPDFGTKFDIVGIFHADCEDLSLEAILLNKDEYEIALRTMVIVIENSIEKALEKMETIDKYLSGVGFFPGKKVIIWLKGKREGKLEEIPILIAEKYEFKEREECHIPGLYDVVNEHIKEILWWSYYESKRRLRQNYTRF